jgi:hypothetical protein
MRETLYAPSAREPYEESVKNWLPFCGSYASHHRSAIPKAYNSEWMNNNAKLWMHWFEKSCKEKKLHYNGNKFCTKTSMNGSFVYVTCWILILFQLIVRPLCRFLQFFLIATLLWFSKSLFFMRCSLMMSIVYKFSGV